MEWDYPEQDPDYRGNELDSILKTGPCEEHQCTDLFWCFLYLLNFAAMIGIAVYAFGHGDLSVFHPYNQQGQQCGVSGSVAQCPYLYIADINDEISYGCISKCPSSPTEAISNTCGFNMGVQYGTSSFKQICQPQKNAITEQQFETLLKEAGIQNAISDVDSVWPVTTGVCLIAIILSIFVTYMIKWYASCMIWSVSTIFVALLTALGGVTYYYSIKTTYLSEWLLGIAITSWVFAGLAIIVIIILCSKIRLAIAVMRAASDFTNDIRSADILPFAVLIICISFFMFWIYCTTYLIACANPHFVNSPFPGLIITESIGWMLASNFFSFYWNCNFFISYCQYVVSSACSMWYFGTAGSDPVGRSIIRGIWHHSGSLALGAFVMTLIKMLQFIFQFVYRCLKDAFLGNREAEGCIKCCCKCCGFVIEYFETYVRFINLNAFAMIAITGKPFCPAAHDAFYLVHRNSTLVSVTDGVGEIFTIISNLFIAIASTFCGVLMVQGIYPGLSIILPGIFFFIITLVIGSLFMNVYGMGVDTILLCYLADEELNKQEGGAQKTPKALQDFLDQYYKQ